MARSTQSIEEVKAENDLLRQRLYQLRSLDKKGRQIAETLGLTIEENK